MMELKKIIVHELQKQSGTAIASIVESNQLIPIDQESESLLEALLKSYQGDKILYAEFDDSPGKYFPGRFKQYQDSQRIDSDFIQFTVDSLGNLVQFIQAKTLASGGYLVFTEYNSNGIDFITIFLIRDTEGKLLRRTINGYEVRTIEYLDTNHLAMACRINENKINSDEDNYLSFTRLRQAEVSDYFTDWISVKQLESSTEFTNALYQIINGLPTPINPETNEELSIDEVRRLVYENVKSNTQQNINLRIISEQVYGDPNIITNFAEQNDISIDTEFRCDKRVLRKFVQLHVNRDGINLKFSRGDVGVKIWPSEENPNQVIIESEKFANALRVEIGNDE